jgi:hypothetical protein
MSIKLKALQGLHVPKEDSLWTTPKASGPDHQRTRSAKGETIGIGQGLAAHVPMVMCIPLKHSVAQVVDFIKGG